MDTRFPGLTKTGFNAVATAHSTINGNITVIS